MIIVKKHDFKPEGRYVTIDEREWLVTNCTMNNAGQICLHLTDVRRSENQIYKLDTLEKLLKKYKL